MVRKFNNTDPPGRRILSVTVERYTDDCPDLSFIGEYSDKPADGAIDREENGDRLRGQYRYFNPGSDPEYARQDYERMEAYERQEWCMVGVRAEARVILSGTVIQELTSSGIWGVESDSEDDYFRELAEQELDDLKDQLLAAGFSAREVKAAFRKAKHN